MLKRKEKNKNNLGKSLLLVIGSLLILLSLLLLFNHAYNTYKDNKKEQEILDTFYEEQEEIKEIINDNNDKNDITINNSNYLAVLKIDKINLEKGLYSIDSNMNNVDYNIEILKESKMPDIENGNLILAGHNGYLKESYFRHLYRLIPSDKVSVFYNGYEYMYEVINTYKVNKTGTVKVIRNNNKTTLTLITCSGDTEQLVVICELVDKK